ncbi:MAG: cytoplasmic protein [Pseudomonadota bacterium]|jgi:hypothetical protein
MNERDRIAAAINLPRAEREVTRWTLLVALWHARPYGADEHLLLNAARDSLLRVTADMIRAELDSLEKRGLIALNRNAPIWWAQLAALGEDVVEYRAAAPVGVFRPPQW